MTNYLKALTMELTALARACGKSNVHHLEPDDLAALTIEAAAMAKVPLAGTDWVPGATATGPERVRWHRAASVSKQRTSREGNRCTSECSWPWTTRR